MSEWVDVRGLSCPLPLMKVKAVMDRGATEIKVHGDTPAARENITRLAENRNYAVTEAKTTPGDWKLVLTSKG
ncbi:SirA-like protein [Moorella thermoacetica]|uniref:SirA-like protein n=1 Tax=Neomoorella thermoacetica TaxID=1525 RepID=A0A1J5JTY4_NEOTH|nr:sulfurtransferase TusA family protein [Moorella thermoacetica]OIQ08039.1 SirA-like protein [Moorella thermoacetica]